MNKTSYPVIFHLSKKKHIGHGIIYVKNCKDPTLSIALKVSAIYSIIILYEHFKVISNYLITFLR